MNDTAPVQSDVRPAQSRHEIVTRIKGAEAELRALHATALYVYGPAATDQLCATDDVHVFIDYDRDGPFSFVELIRAEELLKELLARSIDFTIRDGLDSCARSLVEAHCVRVM